MNHWLKFLQAQIARTGLIATLVRGAGAALTVQGINVGLNYLTQVLLARWLGASDYGVLEYVSTVSLMLGFIASLGLPAIVLRFMAEYVAQQDWGRLRGLIWGSWWQTALAGVGLAGLSSVAILIWHQYRPIQILLPLLLSVAMIPLITLMRVQLEMSRGLRRIVLAYAPSLIGFPLLLLLELLIWRSFYPLTSVVTLMLSIAAIGVALTGQLFLFWRGLPPQVHQTRPVYTPIRQWLRLALPLLFIDGSFLLLNQTDTLMIAGFYNSEAVGIYSAAFKTAGWVNFVLAAVNAIAAPMFAALYAQNNRAELQRLVSTIACWIFYPSLLLGLSLMMFAEPVLALFGPEFVTAKWAMMALILGQLVNVGCGSVGYLLNMTGHQNQCALVVGCSALLNVTLNLIGIPLFGILGAALATAISMMVWNIWMNVLVVKYLGVNPSIVAAIKRASS